MKNIALALLASTALFACSASEAEGTGTNEAAYSIIDAPLAIEVDAKTVHLECTRAHGSFVVLTFEDRIFTAHGEHSLDACVQLRQELAERTTPIKGSLVEEHGAINRGTLGLEVGGWSLVAWGN